MDYYRGVRARSVYRYANMAVQIQVRQQLVHVRGCLPVQGLKYLNFVLRVLYYITGREGAIPIHCVPCGIHIPRHKLKHYFNQIRQYI